MPKILPEEMRECLTNQKAQHTGPNNYHSFLKGIIHRGVKHQPEGKASTGSLTPKVQRREAESSPKVKAALVTIVGKMTSSPRKAHPPRNSMM